MISQAKYASVVILDVTTHYELKMILADCSWYRHCRYHVLCSSWLLGQTLNQGHKTTGTVRCSCWASYKSTSSLYNPCHCWTHCHSGNHVFHLLRWKPSCYTQCCLSTSKGALMTLCADGTSNLNSLCISLGNSVIKHKKPRMHVSLFQMILESLHSFL